MVAFSRFCVFVLLLGSPLVASAGWVTQLVKERQDIFSIFGTSAENVYAVGQAGTLLHSQDAELWTPQVSNTKESLLGIWGGAQSLYVVGTNGTLLRSQSGGPWQKLSPPTKVALRSIWGSSPTDIYIVGDQGTILHSTDGETFTAQKSGVSVSLNSIWGSSANDIYVVGDNGTILYSSDGGSTWSPQQSGTTELLRGVYGLSASDVFVVGYHRTILHSQNSGATWMPRTQGGEEWLASVWGLPATDTTPAVLYAVGSRGLVLCSKDRGFTWELEKNDTVNPLYAVWGASAREVKLAGKGGTMLRMVLPKPALVLTDADASADGAQAFLDGRPIGAVPLLQKLTPGRHFIEVKRPDFSTFSQWVDLEEGAPLTVEVSLSPIKTTFLQVDGPAGAEVLIDNESKGSAPLVVAHMPIGQKVVVTLKKPGFEDWVQAVEVPEEGVHLNPTLVPTKQVEVPPFLQPQTLYKISAGTAVGTLVPVTIAFVYLKKADRLQEINFVNNNGSDTTTAAQEYRRARDVMQTSAFIADGMAILSLGTFITGYALNQRLKEQKVQASLAPGSLKVSVSF